MTEIEKKALALVNAERRKQGLLEPWPYGLAKGVADFKAICRVLKDLEAEKAARAAEREQLEAEKAARAAEREQHEAFRQEVSDAVESTLHSISHWQGCDVEEFRAALSRSIIAKPDPLKDVVADAVNNCASGDKLHEALRAAIEKRGGKIVWEDK